MQRSDFIKSSNFSLRVEMKTYVFQSNCNKIGFLSNHKFLIKLVKVRMKTGAKDFHV